jgi:hypothetical protein
MKWGPCFVTVVFLFFFNGNLALGQTASPAPRPCDLPEGKQFDFWVGDWDLTWPAGQGNSKDQPGKGTNHIEKILGDCIVQEHFENSITHYQGMSVSAYSPQLHEWRQTWVDTDGSYLPFNGTFHDGVMELRTPMHKGPDGTTITSRMVFKNIKPDSFDWDYQISKDDGKTWVDNWSIHYMRRK